VATESALEDIKKAKIENERKQKELTDIEADLNLRAKSIDEELKKLAILRKDIAKEQVAQDQEHQEKVAKLVETLLTMSLLRRPPVTL